MQTVDSSKSHCQRLLLTHNFYHTVWALYKLPFSISSSPKLYQRQMSQILSGLPGVLCHIDNVLIFEAAQTEHDTQQQAALS